MLFYARSIYGDGRNVQAWTVCQDAAQLHCRTGVLAGARNGGQLVRNLALRDRRRFGLCRINGVATERGFGKQYKIATLASSLGEEGEDDSQVVIDAAKLSLHLDQARPHRGCGARLSPTSQKW